MFNLEAEKADMERQIELLKAELTAYVKESGNTDLGVYNVTVSEAKPKINFGAATDNAKKRIIEQLMSELPEYVKEKREPDFEKMYYALSTQPAVANALKVRSLEFDLVTGYTFRKVK